MSGTGTASLTPPGGCPAWRCRWPVQRSQDGSSCVFQQDDSSIVAQGCKGCEAVVSWSFGGRNFQRCYQRRCCSSIAGHSVSAVTHNVEQSKIYPDRNLAAQYMQHRGSETTKEEAYQKCDGIASIAAGRYYSGGGPIVFLHN